ncbi:hypothetical protein [Falsiroseomonas sp.]|uniref:hypothetical protein n=1 Tax=Falsiroseomonas sp. TaxID=2870721 RepID=UPI003565D4A8
MEPRDIIDVLMRYNVEALNMGRHYETLRVALGTVFFTLVAAILLGVAAVVGLREDASDKLAMVRALGWLLVITGVLFGLLFLKIHQRYTRHTWLAQQLGAQVSAILRASGFKPVALDFSRLYESKFGGHYSDPIHIETLNDLYLQTLATDKQMRPITAAIPTRMLWPGLCAAPTLIGIYLATLCRPDGFLELFR